MQRTKHFRVLVRFFLILAAQLYLVSFCFARPPCQQGKVLAKDKQGGTHCCWPKQQGSQKQGACCNGGLSVRTVERTLDVNSPIVLSISPPTSPPPPSPAGSPPVSHVTDDNDDPPAPPSANAPIWRRWGRFMLIQDIGGGTYYGWQGKADVAGTSAVKSAFHHSFSARAEHTIWFGKNDLGVQLGLYGRWSFYQPRLADSFG